MVGAQRHHMETSQGHPIGKGNNKSGMKALRIVHSTCAWGASFFKGKWRAQTWQAFPSYCYGAIPGKAREEAIALQNMLGDRLRTARISFERDYFDVANAFGSPLLARKMRPQKLGV